MYIFNELILQAKKPTGLLGTILARIMNRGHDKLTNWGLNFLNIKNDDKILDIGCGGGRTINKLAKMVKKGKIYGIDYSDVSVKTSSKINKLYINQGKVEIQKAGVSSIPFSKDFFDIITAIETYFLWPDLENDMKEVFRVLKPKGKLLIVSEVYKSDRRDKLVMILEKLNIDLNKIVNSQTKEEFHQLFIDAGYKDVEIHEYAKKGWICGTGIKT
jgi:ubiquinone/menaquinone biosynthesis C-methylase UbiE